MEPRMFLSALPPGAVVPTPGTTLAARPALAGTVIYDNLVGVATTDFNGSIVFYGYLEDRVVRETATGTLDFYQSLRVDLIPHATPISTQIDTVSRSSFSGFATDVDWRSDGLGTPPISPTQASRTADGKTVTFNFDKPISTGQTSFFYFVKTNATNFDVDGQTTLTFGPTPTTTTTVGAATATVQTAEPIRRQESPTGGVRGTVTLGPAGTAGQPLANSPITLTFVQGRTQFTITTITDANGNFVVGALKPGKYSVHLTPPAGTTPAPGTDNATLDVVVKPGRLSNDLNFILKTILQSLDTITGTAGVDQITLVQDPDHTHIDWTLGTTTGQMLINDPNGLTINGNGGNDVITLDYTNGNPLPARLNLNGTFTINGL
jgi:hypothetical protein